MTDDNRPWTAEEFAEWLEEWRRQGCPTKKNGRRMMPYSTRAEREAIARSLAEDRLQNAEREKMLRHGIRYI